jgi:CRP/FNR family transcriptional regulator, cyclic AMP receptor protein
MVTSEHLARASHEREGHVARTIEPSSLGLRRSSLLEGLPAERLDAIAKACAWRLYGEGDQVVSRASSDRSVCLVASGRVRVTTYSASGRQVTFRDVAAGDWFGEVSAIDGLPRSADVQALEDTLLATMPYDVFARLLKEEPAITQQVLQRLVRLVRSLSERVIDISTLGVQHRIHVELLRLAREAGVADNAARIDPAPKHADLAGRVSTYREQVSREMSTLQQSGLLAKDGRALLVCDVKRLAQMVEQERLSS